MIDGPFFAAVRVMELDCRYSSISEADGPEVAVEVDVEFEDSPTIVDVSGARSSAFLRFFFLGELSSGASLRFSRFFLRSGSSEAGISDNTSLASPNDHQWGSAHRWVLRETR